jgi:hypothetical protein
MSKPRACKIQHVDADEERDKVDPRTEMLAASRVDAATHVIEKGLSVLLTEKAARQAPRGFAD